ncbi:hypothetical protein [Spirosoma areae]
MKTLLIVWIIVFGMRIEFTQAQNRVGGHLGFVHPLTTFQREGTTSILDNYVIGFPTGISVQKSDRVAFDLEMVPFVWGSRGVKNLLIHPGVLWGLKNNYTLATRAAFELAGVWGFTPSLTKGFKIKGASTYVDVATPLRWGTGNGPSLTIAIHAGIGF